MLQQHDDDWKHHHASSDVNRSLAVVVQYLQEQGCQSALWMLQIVVDETAANTT